MTYSLDMWYRAELNQKNRISTKSKSFENLYKFVGINTLLTFPVRGIFDNGLYFFSFVSIFFCHGIFIYSLTFGKITFDPPSPEKKCTRNSFDTDRFGSLLFELLFEFVWRFHMGKKPPNTYSIGIMVWKMQLLNDINVLCHLNYR